MTIIVLLFLLQRLGSGAVGRVFGPVMLVWFTTIAVLGIRGITMHPEVLKALSPSYAFDFCSTAARPASSSLTSVVLAFTGVEALYADMGHFGRPAITRAWLLLVFPACILSYLGQGGLILDDPSAISAPFFRLMPHGGLIPLVILATVATVIASQAVISGAFSIAHQAAQLGYLPRLRVVHTSERAYGQVYVPVINRLLLVAVLALVLAFQSSAKLAFAYGTAVTGTILVTSVLFFFIVRHRWHRPLWLTLAGAAFFLIDRARLLRVESDQDRPRRLAAPEDRPRPLLRDGHLVPRARARHRRAIPGRGPAAGVRQGAPRARSAGGPGARHRGVHEPRKGDRAALDARLRGPPALAAGERGDPLAGDDARPADRAQRNGSRSTSSAIEDDRITFVRAKHGYAEEYDVPKLVRQIAKAGVECPVDARHASFYLSRVELTAERPARDEPLAKAPLPGHGADRRRAGRLLQAAARADGHARLRDRVLSRRRTQHVDERRSRR